MTGRLQGVVTQAMRNAAAACPSQACAQATAELDSQPGAQRPHLLCLECQGCTGATSTILGCLLYTGGAGVTMTGATAGGGTGAAATAGGLGGCVQHSTTHACCVRVEQCRVSSSGVEHAEIAVRAWL